MERVKTKQQQKQQQQISAKLTLHGVAERMKFDRLMWMNVRSLSEAPCNTDGKFSCRCANFRSFSSVSDVFFFSSKMFFFFSFGNETSCIVLRHRISQDISSLSK